MYERKIKRKKVKILNPSKIRIGGLYRIQDSLQDFLGLVLILILILAPFGRTEGLRIFRIS